MREFKVLSFPERKTEAQIQNYKQKVHYRMLSGSTSRTEAEGSGTNKGGDGALCLPLQRKCEVGLIFKTVLRRLTL